MQCNLHKADKRVMGSCKLLSWSVCLLIFTENALLSAVFREINTYWHLEALLPRFCPRWLAVKSHRGWIKMIANVLEQCIFGHPQGQTVNGGSSAYRMCLKPYTVWPMENSSSVTFPRKLHNMYMYVLRENIALFPESASLQWDYRALPCLFQSMGVADPSQKITYSFFVIKLHF